jgi:hypothetical protein
MHLLTSLKKKKKKDVLFSRNLSFLELLEAETCCIFCALQVPYIYMGLKLWWSCNSVDTCAYWVIIKYGKFIENWVTCWAYVAWSSSDFFYTLHDIGIFNEYISKRNHIFLVRLYLWFMSAAVWLNLLLCQYIAYAFITWLDYMVPYGISF